MDDARQPGEDATERVSVAREHAGTLYRSLQRMLEEGLIIEVAGRAAMGRPNPDRDDERRRYYRITRFGESVARAEGAA
jgi:DNA-binding PadR family transcriptional regulator